MQSTQEIIQNNVAIMHEMFMQYHESYSQLNEQQYESLALIDVREKPSFIVKDSFEYIAYRTSATIDIEQNNHIYHVPTIKVEEDVDDKSVILYKLPIPNSAEFVAFRIRDNKLIENENHSNTLASLYIENSQKVIEELKKSIVELDEYKKILSGEYQLEDVRKFFDARTPLCCALNILTWPEDKSRKLIDFLTESEPELLKKIPQKYQYKKNILDEIKEFIPGSDFAYLRMKLNQVIEKCYDTFNPFAYQTKLEFKERMEKNLPENENNVKNESIVKM